MILTKWVPDEEKGQVGESEGQREVQGTKHGETQDKAKGQGRRRNK